MSDNTAAEVATARDLRCVAALLRDRDMIVHGVHDFTARDDRTAAVKIEAAADALDALRESVKGCGKNLGISLSDTCDGRPGWLCFDCEDKRDLAIRRLLGSEIEGER